jgi:hypothetical protein
MNRRCAVQRGVRADCGGHIRIRVEVLVDRHPLVHLTAGRTLMVLLQELQDDRVPVQLVRVAVSGRL